MANTKAQCSCQAKLNPHIIQAVRKEHDGQQSFHLGEEGVQPYMVKILIALKLWQVEEEREEPLLTEAL